MYNPTSFTLTLTPSPQQFLEALDAALQGFLESLNSVARLMSRPNLQEITKEETGTRSQLQAQAAAAAAANKDAAAVDKDAASGQGPAALRTFTEAVRDDLFIEQTAELRRRFMAAFERCLQYTQSFQPFLSICQENSLVSRDSLRAEVEAGARDLDLFEADVNKYRQQLVDIRAIPDYATVGIVQLDLRGMKAAMLPSPQRCLDEIYALLPVLGSQYYQEFIEDVHMCYSKLSATPSSVDECVDWLEFLAATVERRDSFEHRQDNVRAHYDFMERFEIQVPALDFASYQTMTSDVNQFREALEVAEASKEGFITKFSQDLDADEERLLQEAEEVRLAAQHEMILDDQSDMEEVLAYTSKLRAQIQEIRESGHRINEFRVIFKVPEKSNPPFDSGTLLRAPPWGFQGGESPVPDPILFLPLASPCLQCGTRWISSTRSGTASRAGASSVRIGASSSWSTWTCRSWKIPPRSMPSWR